MQPTLDSSLGSTEEKNCRKRPQIIWNFWAFSIYSAFCWSRLSNYVRTNNNVLQQSLLHLGLVLVKEAGVDQLLKEKLYVRHLQMIVDESVKVKVWKCESKSVKVKVWKWNWESKSVKVEVWM